MNLTPKGPDVERVTRFQSLQAGQYWRATSDIPSEGIELGVVLLIQSIRWVDKAAHTIILRPHPSKIGTRAEIEEVCEDGSTKTHYVRYDEHRFLLREFLDHFEFEPEHQRIRSEEVRAVQNQVSALQSELVETQSNPALLAKIVDEGLREQAQASRSDAPGCDSADQFPSTPDNTAGLVALATGTVANAIGSGITPEMVIAMKAAAGREHQVATIKAKWIQGKTGEIAATIKAMTPYYEEQAAAVLAQTEDVRAYVTALMEGIESLDLYVGKDVEVEAIRKGDSAPREVPLTFVQKKLLMDEELAVWADIDEWFDFSEEKKFFDALRNHDDLIEQIFPTTRCVLVMATTRRYIDYGDRMTNAMRNRENRKVFLLVRDGMNIHRVFSSVESHLGTARLFPTKDDQDRVFRGFDGSEVTFEDVAYTDSLADHERFALHFKRFLLLACGLDHRLKLFGDFYDGPPTLDFVTMAFQEAHCRFLHDDDASISLSGPGRPSVRDWIADKNAHLGSGSRVLCNWWSLMNPKTAPGACKYNHHSGRGFDFSYQPGERIGLAIASKEGDALCVSVEVSGYSYSKHAQRTFQCKVNLSKSTDSYEMPFLCLDAVSPEEVHWYIHHRQARVDHLQYLQFFKRALKFIESERAEERDTRDRLLQALADGRIGSPDERPALIDQCVIAWRSAHRGKPLPRFEGDAAPAAWKSLLDQLFLLAGEGRSRMEAISAFVQSMGLTPLRLVVSGNAKMAVYAAPLAEERDDRLEEHPWVHRIMVEKTKTGYTQKGRRWALLPAQEASETLLHDWPDAKDWVGRDSAFPSFERKQAIFAAVSRFRESMAPFAKTMSPGQHLVEFELWQQLRRDLTEGSKYVQNPSIAIPFGLAIRPRSKKIRVLCAGSHRPHALLGRLAPDAATLGQVRAAFLSPYARKQSAAAAFDEAMTATSDWVLMEGSLALLEDLEGVYIPSMHINDASFNAMSPLLADHLPRWRKEQGDATRVWLADGACADDGRLLIDDMLGIKLPEGYCPVRTLHISLTGNELPAFNEWVDICPLTDSAESDNLPSLNSRGWLMSAERDELLKSLVRTVVAEGSFGYRTHYNKYASPEQARAAILRQRTEGGDSCRAVLASDLPDAPPPPPGIERWYFVSGDD